MFKKLYVKISDFIKETYLFFIAFIITFIVFTFPLPYFISAPGGIIDVSSKIKIEGYDIKKDLFNMAYIHEYRATIPTFLYAKLNKKWDINKEEEIVLDNETYEENLVRNRLLLNEANQSAIMVAFKKANKKIEIKDTNLFISYIDTLANTNLMVGDELLEIENTKINNISELKKIIQEKKKDESINFKVKRDNKEISCYAKLFEYESELLIGIMISTNYDLETTPNIKFQFTEKESGPSGGMMMALTIYDTLTDKKVSRNIKIAGTGTIDKEGIVGDIGGVKYKVLSADKAKANVFLVPNGDNYKEALKTKNEYNLQIEIIPIDSFDEVIDYLYD